MNIVFDTNVLVSAFLFGGTSGKAIEFCIENDEIYISPFIKEELTLILQTKFRLINSDIAVISEMLASGFSQVRPNTPIPIVCRDKDDNNILQLAESVHAHFIITGDNDLLILKQYKNTLIVSPAEFLKIR